MTDNNSEIQRNGITIEEYLKRRQAMRKKELSSAQKELAQNESAVLKLSGLLLV